MTIFFVFVLMINLDPNISIRYTQIGIKKFLGDLESEIMLIVWEKTKSSITVRDVFEILSKKRPIAYTTVMTTINRLHEKDLLKIVDKVGLANHYAPSMTKSKFIKTHCNAVFDSFYRDFKAEFAEYNAKKF